MIRHYSRYNRATSKSHTEIDGTLGQEPIIYTLAKQTVFLLTISMVILYLFGRAYYSAIGIDFSMVNIPIYDYFMKYSLEFAIILILFL